MASLSGQRAPGEGAVRALRTAQRPPERRDRHGNDAEGGEHPVRKPDMDHLDFVPPQGRAPASICVTDFCK
jgi:hypothetical protein